MALKVGYKALLLQAEHQIETLGPSQALALLDNDDVQFVDIRDVRELSTRGKRQEFPWKNSHPKSPDQPR